MTRLQESRFSVPVLLEYIAKTFLVRFLILLIGISFIMQTLDVLSQTGELLAPEGATASSLWRFTLLRYPQMITTVIPFSALLATLLTATTLAQHSEVVVMQSSGLSAFRIVFPMIGICAVIALVHFAFNETIVVRTNEAYEGWQESGFVPDAKETPKTISGAWAVDGDRLVRVQGVSREGTLLDKMTLYEIGKDGRILLLTAVDFAVYNDGEWTLFDVTEFSIPSNTVTAESRRKWSTNLRPERFRALSVKGDTVPFGELEETLDDLSGETLASNKLRAALQHKISGPLGTVLMPLLGAIAAFGVFRSGTQFLRVIGGLAFGFSYFVVDNLLLAVGQFGTVPPEIAAWAPFFLFLFLGSSVLFYTEE